jgi:hypothetical protein
MADFLPPALFILFAVHLGAFAMLGLRRRQWYYLALVVTFSLLTASAGLRWLAPEWAFTAAPAHLLLRQAALVCACFSLTWTAMRLKNRLLKRHGQHQAG